MNRLRIAFEHHQQDAAPRLLPYVTAAYPDIPTTLAILRRLDPAQCLSVELGIPFSDPIADGPVIQASFSRALDAGFKLEPLFEAIQRERDAIRVPLVAMVSYTIVYRRGAEAFVKRAREAGFDGLIVPDLAFEEADDLAEIGRAHDCPLVMMVAPTSDAGRRQRIAKISEPFIYYQSVAGVTGERTQLPQDLIDQVRQLRGDSGKPVCVGFGISTPEQVRAVCSVGDGAIVGSAIVRRITAAIENGQRGEQIAGVVADFVAELSG